MNRNPYICTVAFAGLLGLALVQPAKAQSSSQDNQRNYDNSQQGQNENSQRYEQNQAQDDQNNNGNSLSGVVQSYREVNVNGTPHFCVRLETQNGQSQSVDLGPTSRSRQLIDNIEEGESISVRGREQDMNGKSVFMADRARVGGRSYWISGSEMADLDPEQGEEAGAQQGQQRPRALVLLEQRYVFVTPSDLSRHLIMAEEDLRNGDPRAGAAELRVAADRLGVYAAAARNQGKVAQDLNNTRQELESLADQISRNGNSQRLRELEEAAARAHLAMAKFFDSRLRAEQQKGRTIEAGYDLQAAAIHARQALMWSSGNEQQDAVRAIHQALRTADQLTAGNQNQAGNVLEVAQNLSRQINQIDQQIGQGQAQEAGAYQPAQQQQNRDRKQQQQQRQQQQNNEQGSDSNGR